MFSQPNKLKAAMLTFVSASLLLAACAAPAPAAPSAPAAPATEATAASATEATAAPAAEQPAAEATAAPAASGEVPTLQYHFVAGNAKDAAEVEAAVNAILEPKIGAKLKFNTYGFSDANQKIMLMLQSGEPCDLVAVSGFVPYIPAVGTGSLLALDDLLPQHAPNLWARMQPEWWNAARVDGKIYNALNYNGWTGYAGFWARSDLIEKYDFDWQNTTKWEDWEPFFDNIVANEKGVTPIISSDMWGQVWFPSYYGYDPVDDGIGSGRGGSLLGVKVGDPDRKVVLTLDTPEYRQALDMVKRWHDKGYFAQDIVPDNDMIAKRGELGYGVFMFPGVGDFSTKAMADTEWKGVPIFTKPLQPKTLLTTGIGRTGTAVCSTSQHPDLAVKYIEEVNQNPELYNLLNFGIEGKHWQWVDKDKKLIGLPEGMTMETVGWLPNTYWQFGDRRQLYLTDPADIGVFDRIDKALAEADISPVMGFTFDRKPVENEIAQVNTVAKEFETLNRGMVDDIDAKLAEYKTRLQEAGIDKIIAEMQSQIDAWAKTLPAQ
jgi:putative aldouronate transport system substrate-binding protein